MTEYPLVSILTPCYNSESYIARMLDSVLTQTYKNIELICIDDGSTDNTASIIVEYIPVFEKANKKLHYIKKDHNGQAAAINAGLKIMNGEYFTLLDSDDFLLDSSIEKRVAMLQNNPEYSIVASDYYIVEEENLDKIVGRGNDCVGNLCYQANQFYLLLAGLSVVTPISYLIRTNDMRKINYDMRIHECKEGQNYQILLPLYYFYKRIYLDEPTGYYVVRQNSHDHVKRAQEELYQRYENLYCMLSDILDQLNITNGEKDILLRSSHFKRKMEEHWHGQDK